MRALPIILQVFLTLHSIDDRLVAVNIHEIVSITTPGGQLVKDANCLIGTTDGKFFTVVEKCSDIIQLLATNKF